MNAGCKKEDMNKQLLDRREFGLCALGLPLFTISTMFAASSSASPLAAAIGTAPDTAGRRVKFRDGTIVPALGQGSHRDGIPRLMRKKHCAQAFRLA